MVLIGVTNFLFIDWLERKRPEETALKSGIVIIQNNVIVILRK